MSGEKEMTARLRIDEAGRIAIPQSLREQMDLGPGDTVDLESDGEHITVSPVRTHLAKEHGFWVWKTGEPLEPRVADELIRQLREERDLANLGQPGE